MKKEITVYGVVPSITDGKPEVISVIGELNTEEQILIDRRELGLREWELWNEGLYHESNLAKTPLVAIEWAEAQAEEKLQKLKAELERAQVWRGELVKLRIEKFTPKVSDIPPSLDRHPHPMTRMGEASYHPIIDFPPPNFLEPYWKKTP